MTYAVGLCIDDRLSLIPNERCQDIPIFLDFPRGPQLRKREARQWPLPWSECTASPLFCGPLINCHGKFFFTKHSHTTQEHQKSRYEALPLQRGEALIKLILTQEKFHKKDTDAAGPL